MDTSGDKLKRACPGACPDLTREVLSFQELSLFFITIILLLLLLLFFLGGRLI